MSFSLYNENSMKAGGKGRKSTKKAVEPLPETIEERVHRHLTDIHSEITDADIKNVRIELGIRGEGAENAAEQASEGGQTPERSDNSENSDNETETPSANGDA
jgi:hypothetical protein